jgi:hypothetical protein
MCQDTRTEDAGFFDPTNPLHAELQELHRSDHPEPRTEPTEGTSDPNEHSWYENHGHGD